MDGYEVYLKNGSAWSSFDLLDEPMTRREYAEMLAADRDYSALKALAAADDYKCIKA